MKQLFAYLKANWKHLSVAAIIAIYNILVAAGIIPANYQLTISAILAAFGISLTTNSGTADAVKSATPKMIVLLLGFMFLVNHKSNAQANSLQQMPGTKWLNAGDTIINTGTAADTFLMPNAFATGSIVVYVTKVSGTVSPTIIVQGSVDGHAWTTFGEDTLVLSNATGTVNKTWKCLSPLATAYAAAPPVLPFLYYRVFATGTGTMKAIIKSWIAPR